MDLPIPLSELENVLAWVDGFKLSRPTRKINRDFSDAVLLAEILNTHYPKLVEMHNYPPRNSHALKLNNWMTLNRKVLKKLKLNLCCSTMDQLANAAPGLIERVLIMVRDKIHRDEDLNKSMKDAEQNVSSGGSYYEACGDEDNVLVIPVKTRVNGVLETVQKKVVNYDLYNSIKEELKDAKDSTELLKQKVEHLDNLLKLKDERIEELQKQLDRKQARRKEIETLQNSIAVPFEVVQSPVPADLISVSRKSSQKAVESNIKIVVSKPEDSPKKRVDSNSKIPTAKSESKIPKDKSKVPKEIETPITKSPSKPSITEVSLKDITNQNVNVEKVNSDVFLDTNMNRSKSDVFKEVDKVDIVETIEHDPNGKNGVDDTPHYEVQHFEETIKVNNPASQDVDEFKDTQQEIVITIEETIEKEITEISKPRVVHSDLNYVL